MPDDTEKSVGFVSRTLTDTEKKYSQIEKEGIACVFGVRKFDTYLFGCHFTLQTDHKPLMTLFNGTKGSPVQASARIKRWALSLSAYEYTIACRTTKQHANADAMSRLPLPEASESTFILAVLVLMIEKMNDVPVIAKQIASWTQRDPLLSRVLYYIQQGWPKVADEELKPYN